MMGLLQKAIETYDSHYTYASKNQISSSMMAPIGHIVTRAELEITLDEDGRFVSASAVDKSEPKIIIPATESSSGRTSAPCAHPLCEQLGYLMPENDVKYHLYVEQLTAWKNSEYTHPKLSPVLKYVEGGTVLSDLIRCGLLQINKDGKPDGEKQLIRWRVLGSDEDACWLDRSLFTAFTNYYVNNFGAETALCMVTGNETAAARQHPKGIVPINGNAKLISANDSSGFTYRGRFTEEWQAASVGYEASQKAHSALRWLIQEQGVIFGGRTFLCWNPQGRTIVMAANPLLRAAKPIFRPSDYYQALKNELAGRQAELNITDSVVIAIFDAATSGRLSLTYYNELQGYDFLQRLHDWDTSCCWINGRFGIETPTLHQIVDYAFGTQRTEKGIAKMDTDERILRQQMQRLISCRVDRVPLSLEIIKALTDRASRPLSYEKNVRETMLFAACAVIRKYRYERFKEEWSMALEPERKDLSYQFGRLLAVMEKIERDTYNSSEGREPNAIRLQSVFCQRPMHTAHQLEKQLERAYFPRLRPGSRIWYKNLLGEIMDVISTFPSEEWNSPLNETYLMGYYLQRATLYTKKSDSATEEMNDE